MPPLPPVTPVTVSCIEQAVNTYQIPKLILLSVMANEGGVPGKTSLNRNGSRDMGPMQINTSWLPTLKKNGITEHEVINNGCLNVFIGAAILKKHANELGGNWWNAVGAYHAGNALPKSKQKREGYIGRVAKRAYSILARAEAVNKKQR